MSHTQKTIAPSEPVSAGSIASELGRASVVIACYADTDIVERNLAALARQSFRDFEVIIADDGSPDDYTLLLERWAGRFAHPLQHVRHPDDGFRKTRILNRAVLVSKFDRLIFVDRTCPRRSRFGSAVWDLVRCG